MTTFPLRLLMIAAAIVMLFPGTLKAQEEIELLDGTKLHGKIRSIQDGTLVMETGPEGSVVEVPFKALSPYQQYKARTWRLREGDLDPNDPAVRLNLGKWSFEHRAFDGRLEDAAKNQFQRAEQLGGEEMKETIKQYLLEHDIMVNDKGEWVSAEQYWIDKGYVKDPETGEWVSPAEMKRREEERSKQLKTRPLIPVERRDDYKRVFIPILDASLADYSKDLYTDERFRKIRFFARFLEADTDFAEKVQPEGEALLTSEKHMKLFLLDEDVHEVFAGNRKHGGKLVKKIALFKEGERVQVFGQVYLTKDGFAILVDDLVPE